MWPFKSKAPKPLSPAVASAIKLMEESPLDAWRVVATNLWHLIHNKTKITVWGGALPCYGDMCFDDGPWLGDLLKDHERVAIHKAVKNLVQRRIQAGLVHNSQNIINSVNKYLSQQDKLNA